jgi:phosphatidylserine/phosphatidylglycerophosphate/cardiolipin synthase-like enzyme
VGIAGGRLYLLLASGFPECSSRSSIWSGADRKRAVVSTFGSCACSLTPCGADPAPAIHYAPGENLEHIDVALIDRGEHEIDMAAYVLTDWPVMKALTRAADRGVYIRIYFDGTQLAEREPAKVFRDLAETPGVEIRIKHETSDPMHLKSYVIDGKLLRTGAVNFSASGLKRQDNDLIVIESEAAESFKRNFYARFVSGEALSAGAR